MSELCNCVTPLEDNAQKDLPSNEVYWIYLNDEIFASTLLLFLQILLHEHRESTFCLEQNSKSLHFPGPDVEILKQVSNWANYVRLI